MLKIACDLALREQGHTRHGIIIVQDTNKHQSRGPSHSDLFINLIQIVVFVLTNGSILLCLRL